MDRANFIATHLEGTSLTHTYLDAAADLTDSWISDNMGWLAYLLRALRHLSTYGSVSLADVRWNGADLTAVDWSGLQTLGDERTKRWWWRSREESERALRANIQLAKQLDNAGLKGDADRFSYRAQVCRRSLQDNPVLHDGATQHRSSTSYGDLGASGCTTTTSLMKRRWWSHSQ